MFGQLKCGVGARAIQVYAEKIAMEMGVVGFSPDSGWFSRFCLRHSIVREALHGEAGDVNEVEQRRAVEEIRQRLEQVHVDDVYNMDETGLFYK